MPPNESKPPTSFNIGNVLRVQVADTTPPKVKLFIIVGFSSDYSSVATVYINSRINKNANWSIDHQAAQYELSSEGRSYLDYDSYVDCARIKEWHINEIQSIIDSRPEAIFGKLSEHDLNEILNTLKHTTTLKGKDKKKYGFYED